MDIVTKAKELQSEIVRLRRHFHQYPEASLKEYETAKTIKATLDSYGIPYQSVGETGVLATIQGQSSGKTVLLRADIDALEIEEETGVDYISKHKGLCHACGHDAHTAMGLATAYLLNQQKQNFSGTALIAFQQAEEIGAGAKQFVSSGLIQKIDESFAIHVRSDLPSHQLAVRGGAVNASCDIFKMTITGKSSHVGQPHLSKDALVTASELVVALQTVVAREISPVENAVVGIGKFHAGTRYNIVANEAVLEGTIRAFSHETRAHLKEAIERIANGIVLAHRCEVSFEWYDAAAPVINDEKLAGKAAKIAENLSIFEKVVTEYEESMGADDFADFQVDKPGVYVLLGTQKDEATAYGHHHEKFNIDEDVLYKGVAFEVSYFLNALEK